MSSICWKAFDKGALVDVTGGGRVPSIDRLKAAAKAVALLRNQYGGHSYTFSWSTSANDLKRRGRIDL